MEIRLFEIDGRVVRPTEHCYMISWLNCIIEHFPDDHLKVLAYVYYMSYTGPNNPYTNIVEEDREQKIMQSLEPEFDTEDPNTYLKNTPVTDGRDGNIGPLLRVAKEFKAVRESFKGVQDDVIAESKVKARGKSKLPYDMQ